MTTVGAEGEIADKLTKMVTDALIEQISARFSGSLVGAALNLAKAMTQAVAEIVKRLHGEATEADVVGTADALDGLATAATDFIIDTLTKVAAGPRTTAENRAAIARVVHILRATK